jgi:hypothetical protein
MGTPTTLEEQKRLMGLAPRYNYSTKTEATGSPDVSDPVHPDSPEDDEAPLMTPSASEEPPPNVQGAGASKHWEMYRKMEEKAMKLHGENIEMLNQMSEITEGEMSRYQRSSLRRAQVAVKEACSVQKEAFRRISEFGATLLGK